MLENLFIPVITTDKNGTITYKNTAAKRCVPTPRRGGNILKHTLPPVPCLNIEKVLILSVENTTSVFNRAFVLEYENEIYWIFSPELALAEQNDIIRIPPSDLEQLLSHIKILIEWTKTANTHPCVTRLFRMEEEMFYALKKIGLRYYYGKFDSENVISSIYEETLRISNALNFRISVILENDPFIDKKQIRFIPLAVTYIYSLLFFLNIGSSAECKVKIRHTNDKIDFLLKTSLCLPKDRLYKSIEDIAELLPKDALNLMLLIQNAALNELSIFFNLDGDGVLTLRLSPPVEDADDMFLFQPAVSAQKNEFRKIKSYISKYIDNILNIDRVK